MMNFRRLAGKIKNLYVSCSNSLPFDSKLSVYRNFSTSVYLVDEEKDSLKSKTKSCFYTSRSCTCGDLKSVDVGTEVTLCGWLEYQRLDKFLILRDGYGETQLIIKDDDKKLKSIAGKIPLESILKVKGTVLARPKDMVNPKLTTGTIEVLIDSLEILNEASDLPFNIRGFQKPKEALRMQYRYLDLRFPQMQRNLRVRSDILYKMRKFLMEANFVDVETPTLFKATPGGAQEFIVPTKFPGQFYSLVQSPQQFKQILMAGEIDRYFQVARCYRDESSKPDRQPEFTQLDIEMSFTSPNGIMKLIEDLLNSCWPDFAGTIPHQFDRISHSDAMEFYGTDKPDTSFDFKLKNCTSILKPMNPELKDSRFGAYSLQFPENGIFTKSIQEQFKLLSKDFPDAKFTQNRISNVQNWIHKMGKLLGEEVASNLADTIKLENNSVLFLAYGEKKQVLNLLGRVRLSYVDVTEARGITLRRKGMHLVWIVDFPLFEQNDPSNTLSSAHHPFTAPNTEDLHLLEKDPLKVRALAYDLVLNGNEIAGGSIRIHSPTLQEQVFKIVNIDPSTMKHILDMLGSGCPPHGGIAIGLDRLLSILLNTQSIRDVIAFPKGGEGRDLLSGAPSPVTEKDLKMYHIRTVEK